MGRDKVANDLREQFPALEQKVNGYNLIYLDSAATSLKPYSVIQRMQHYYQFETANVHRGAHYLADRLTVAFEEVREQVRNFINAKETREIVFVRGTTEGVNLAANCLADFYFREGDTLLVTEMEHHSNIVPWQMIAQKKSLKLEVVKITEQGDLDLKDLQNKLPGSRLLAFSGCSNVLGTITEVGKICQMAKSHGVLTLVDAAQSVCHDIIDVQKWNCDFLVFSGHKIFAPMGIGILYGKCELLNQFPPYQGGGSMISEVCWTGTTFNEIPYRFEAGTPNVDGVIGLGSALKFIKDWKIHETHEDQYKLLNFAKGQLRNIEGLRILGNPTRHAGLLSFNFVDVHHSDVAQLVDQKGIAVRSGHLCAQPLMSRFGITGAIRASLSVFNDEKDIEELVAAIKMAREMLK